MKNKRLRPALFHLGLPLNHSSFLYDLRIRYPFLTVSLRIRCSCTDPVYDLRISPFFTVNGRLRPCMFDLGIDDYLRIYGSSWRPVGQSSWSDIPSNSDIVVTHNPPTSRNGSHVDLEVNLQLRLNQIKPLLSVFGHIHADYGVWKHLNGILFANAASSPSSSSRILNDPLRFKISIDENSMTSIEHLI